ncbi:hypothetical protein Z517_12322 [Fonsecaea pedrosoi CBS 271.37]|uniref:Uncharacterized protein n=1 Tax=Fonsecaea pedrosoi CBS 271.37 TaxID=1442368 RepID=A0A0D2EJ24_9EURO|nr:uncharacterized protein Z517_12322 [Fonsecaea pedrosoi CBS 271.37]KIW74382.1 hypothetical protein Z517_12322 [Fonsecaea pedrosoi CBS 271.37]
MSPPANDKSKSASLNAETASIQSTSTMSSLKALLHPKNKKEKTRVPPETMEQKTTRTEATATYMAMR